MLARVPVQRGASEAPVQVTEESRALTAQLLVAIGYALFLAVGVQQQFAQSVNWFRENSVRPMLQQQAATSHTHTDLQ